MFPIIINDDRLTHIIMNNLYAKLELEMTIVKHCFEQHGFN